MKYFAISKKLCRYKINASANGGVDGCLDIFSIDTHRAEDGEAGFIVIGAGETAYERYREFAGTDRTVTYRRCRALR